MDERGYLPTIFLKQPDPQEYAYRPVYLSIISLVMTAIEARLTRSTIALQICPRQRKRTV